MAINVSEFFRDLQLFEQIRAMFCAASASQPS
jgi:chemotaxis methyl-accepting protein methylase